MKARDRFSIRWSNDLKVSDGGEISKTSFRYFSRALDSRRIRFVKGCYEYELGTKVFGQLRIVFVPKDLSICFGNSLLVRRFRNPVCSLWSRRFV